MGEGLWLPKGFELADGSKIRSLLYSGDEWQIFDTNGSNNILLARSALVQKWDEFRLLDKTMFGDVTFDNGSFCILSSHKKYALMAVENSPSLASKVDALAFAFAIRESRKLADGSSLHDAIYVEQYSRLLPSWTPSLYVDDKIVMGTWITGGVVISTESFRRLTKLVGWLSVMDLVEVLKTAGFGLPSDAGLLTKYKPEPKAKSDIDPGYVTEKDESVKHQALNKSIETKVFKLPGRLHLEAFFNEHIIDIIFNAEKYRPLGILFPSAVILHGPPGCGKTFSVERLVEFIAWPSYSIDSNSVGSPYIHETSKKISEVFDKAIDDAPSIIVIDEMESFLSDRCTGSSTGLHHVEEVAEFLRRIPEAINNNVLIIAMTNLIEMIDPAILRRGRFDHIIEVGMPSKEEVTSLIDSLLKKLPKAADLKVDEIIDELTGKALSDSAFLMREAARIAARDGKSELDQESIIMAMSGLPRNQEKSSRRIGFVWDDK